MCSNPLRYRMCLALLALAALVLGGCPPAQPPTVTPPDCDCETELRDGGFVRARVLFRDGKPVRVWPNPAIVELAPEADRQFDSQYRVRWIASRGDLEDGHTLAIREKENDQPNAGVFGVEEFVFKTDPEDSGRLIAESTFPLEDFQPTWAGFAHPETNEHLVGDEAWSLMRDQASHNRSVKLGRAPSYDQETLTALWGGKVLRIALWHYDVVVRDARGNEVAVLDPTMVIKECP